MVQRETSAEAANSESITESMRIAQQEAEEEAELLVKNESAEDDSSNVLVTIPKLLQSSLSGPNNIQQLVEKTQDLKSRGKQLDLLLLKAETYSHFIRENQKRTIENLEKAQQQSKDNIAEPVKGNKRKAKSDSQMSSPAKRARDNNHQSLEISPKFIQPSNLVGGTLMPYQLEGLKWLLSLWENGLSGILADEMGLGKTIQIISLIAKLRLANTSGPFLIAGPLATLPNWLNEFKKWLPSCPVVLYHGSKEERHQIRSHSLPSSNQKSLEFPVVITSFEICIIDRPFLSRYDWQYIILDEGHRIKNRNCRLVKELKQIPSVSRLLLTGTPIQNTLDELWSLLNFVNPMIFDNLEVFQSWFGFHMIGKKTKVEDIIDNEEQEKIVSKLHEILRPFLLRRMKRDVLINMPMKREVVIYCGMSSLQRDYYIRVQQGDIRETLLSMGIEEAKDMTTLNPYMNLRKVCNHPFLFGEPRGVDGQYISESSPRLLTLASGKFRVLDRLLRRLKADGHKVLIFSQMTKLLDILQDYMNIQNYPFRRLDGNVKMLARQRSIDAFNTDPSLFCFLLSTRAGGLGINLTAADTIIIFDSDWNPHQDSQAMDRCHRIGQKRPVAVYRLLTAGSVEINMIASQISKKKLERMTIHGGDYRMAGQRSSGSLTIHRLRELLEDDVRNLSRMTPTAANVESLIMMEGSGLDAPDTAGGTAGTTGGGTSRGVITSLLMNDISEEEFEKIINRDLLFAENWQENIPSEGLMYDIVRTNDNVLQTVGGG